MAALVSDACALIALAEREEGSDLVFSLLADLENTCFVHWVNLCEEGEPRVTLTNGRIELF